MGLTFQEQLSSLPIQRLNTVLRVNFDLREQSDAFNLAMQMVETWWNKKAEPYQTKISPEATELSFAQSGFKVEFARTEEAFALSMEEPDSSLLGRFWICDFALKLNGGRPQFSVRIGFRQPHNIPNQPEPRAPRFLRDIVEQVGAIDFLPMKSITQVIDPDSLPFFMDLITSPQRTLPVIAISEDERSGSVFANTDALARVLAGTAHVLRLDSESSWQLSRDWGKDCRHFRAQSVATIQNSRGLTTNTSIGYGFQKRSNGQTLRHETDL
jgi:hypothetical protein